MRRKAGLMRKILNLAVFTSLALAASYSAFAANTGAEFKRDDLQSMAVTSVAVKVFSDEMRAHGRLTGADFEVDLDAKVYFSKTLKQFEAQFFDDYSSDRTQLTGKALDEVRKLCGKVTSKWDTLYLYKGKHYEDALTLNPKQYTGSRALPINAMRVIFKRSILTGTIDSAGYPLWRIVAEGDHMINCGDIEL